MNKKYPKIFEPLTIKRTTIKNRIAMTPMGTNYGETSGEMSSRHMNYYTLRSKGGTGLIILENANVEYPVGSNGTSQIRIDHDSFMPRFYQLVETLHKSGTTVAIQINHAGASASSARTGMQTVSSSNIPTKAGGEIPRPMTREEILHTVRKYGEAARRARDIGFDAIEIHCGHSYLMSQFISPYYNKRTDEFGGSVENRLRFPRMVLEEVRKQVGPWFPIIVRISAEERVEGGNTLEDTLEYLEYLDEFVDLYDVSCGLNPSLQYQIDSNFLEDGWRSYMARAVKDKFGKPVMNAGNYRDPEVVEKILESGDVDIVGMGRGLIAEPDWVNKVENGQEELLRKCISCNVGCAGNRIGVNRPIRCTVNPAVPEGDVYKKTESEQAVQCGRDRGRYGWYGGGLHGGRGRLQRVPVREKRSYRRSVLFHFGSAKQAENEGFPEISGSKSSPSGQLVYFPEYGSDDRQDQNIQAGHHCPCDRFRSACSANQGIKGKSGGEKRFDHFRYDQQLQCRYVSG